MLLQMNPMNITVTFIKKNEITSNGSTIVQIVVILLIPNVLLGKTQIGRNRYILLIPNVLLGKNRIGRNRYISHLFGDATY